MRSSSPNSSTFSPMASGSGIKMKCISTVNSAISAETVNISKYHLLPPKVFNRKEASYNPTILPRLTQVVQNPIIVPLPFFGNHSPSIATKLIKMSEVTSPMIGNTVK